MRMDGAGTVGLTMEAEAERQTKDPKLEEIGLCLATGRVPMEETRRIGGVVGGLMVEWKERMLVVQLR